MTQKHEPICLDQDFGKSIQNRGNTFFTFGVLARHAHIRAILGCQFNPINFEKPEIEQYTHKVFCIRQKRFNSFAPPEFVFLQYYDFGAYKLRSQNYTWIKETKNTQFLLSRQLVQRLSFHLEHVKSYYFAGLPGGNTEEIANDINYYWAIVINNIVVNLLTERKNTVRGVILDD